MGFDLSIQLHLCMCPQSGIPFAWDTYLGKTYVNLSDYVVPPEFRKWVQARGRHFHSYILWCDESTSSCDVGLFLENFPEWKDVDNWTEKDHNEFKAALEYFARYPGYVVSWSY